MGRTEKTETGQKEMEENGGSDGVSNAHWWWALAGATQLGWGIASFRRGLIGNSSLVPLKAFAIASLFVGGGASCAIASLKASGIHKVEDMMEVGASIRSGLGIRPRPQDE